MPAGSSILVVEDDDAFRALVAGALRDDGHHVEEAKNGREALSRLSPLGFLAPPDAMVIDVRMPGISGLEVLASVRRAEAHSPLVFVMSAFCDDDARLRALALGARAVFEKPFDLDELRKVVLAALTTPPSWT